MNRLHTSVQRRVALYFEAQEKKAMTAPTPPTSTLVRPFTVSIPDSEIDDLKQRLARTRWPDPETVGDWSQGVRVENDAAASQLPTAYTERKSSPTPARLPGRTSEHR
jgi:hypothetical protein